MRSRIFLVVATVVAMANVWATDAHADKLPRSGNLCIEHWSAPKQLEDGSFIVIIDVRCSKKDAKRRGLR